MLVAAADAELLHELLAAVFAMSGRSMSVLLIGIPELSESGTHTR